MKNILNPNSRLSKSLINVATGGVLQFLTIVLNFVVRIVFVRVVGYSYLGISSLFANILTVLSVADLGFGTSISISLYSALKKADENHIAGIITYYKKIYLIIGSVIFGIGCVICPFVGYIVNTTTPVPFLELYFFIYLINLVCTYFVSYRHAIIKADQKNGILNLVHSAVLLGKSVVELIVICVLSRFIEIQYVYITYLVVMVVSTYLSEIICASIAKKMYPYAFKRAEIPISEKVEISQNVRSLLLYKVCNAVNKSADSILISILVSTTILGKYSNYTLIINVLMGFGCLISRNSIASLGNYVLSESNEKQIKMFNLINFIHILMSAFFIINYVGILNPFFHLAFGADSTLSLLTLVFTAIHLGFNMNYQVNELFRETTKMFRKIPYISAINLVLNIGLSILLGYYFGLEGILGGTLAAYFLTSFWFETFALFKFYFKSSSKNVWLKLLYSVAVIALFSTAAYFLSEKIVLDNQITQLIFSVCTSLALSFFCACSFFWFPEFKTVFNAIKRFYNLIKTKIDNSVGKKKAQLAILISSIVLFTLTISIRDLGGIDLNKYIIVALCFVSGMLLDKEYFLAYLFFLIPFHSGIPTRIIYPLLLGLMLLKNISTFKNWKLIINYFLIPTYVVAAELVMSTIYGGTTSFDVALLIWSILSIFSFVIYNKNSISTKPIKYFIVGLTLASLILFGSWIKVAWYMSSHSSVRGMDFISILTKERFGNTTGLIEWCEYWCQITYPYKVSMSLGDNENYVGLLMLVGIMVSSYLLFNRDDKVIKVLLTLSIILFTFFGIYTASKSFFICLAIFVLLFIGMLYAENKINVVVAILLLGSIVGVGLIVCFKVPFVYKFVIGRLGNDSGRMKLIQEYLGYIFKDPLTSIFGVGASRLQPLFGNNEPPHNSLVQIIGGYGLVGLGVILFGLVLTIVKRKQKISIIKDNILVAFSPLLVYFVFTLTSQIFLPPNTLIFGLPVIYVFVSRINYVSQKEKIIFYVRKDDKKMIKSRKNKAEVTLITGVAGFIGSHVAKELLKNENVTIIGLDNMSDYYSVSLKKKRVKQLKNSKNFIFVKGDISDRETIDYIFNKYNIKIVINFADQSGSRLSHQYSDIFVQSNIIGMFYILEACRENNVKHLVYASSSSVYGDIKDPSSSNESKTDNPLSLYAATKKSNELLVQTYSKLYNIPATCLRFYTVYGPEGRPDMAYYLFTENLVNKKPIDLFNYGNSKRDYIYIDDAVDIIVKIVFTPPKLGTNDDGSQKVPHRIYNIGSGTSISTLEFTNLLVEQLKHEKLVNEGFDVKEYVRLASPQKGEAINACADISGLVKDFGFKPSVTIENGLRCFTLWYKDYYGVNNE